MQTKVALLALLTAAALFAQKVHPRLTALAEPGARLPVLVLLLHQPQREIIARVRGAAALRTGMLEGRWQQAAGQRSASAGEVREARAQLDAAIVETRQAALREIRDATLLEQQALESRLTGLGASAIHRYAILNAVAAHLPAGGLAALAADPEVAAVVPLEWHEGLLDVSTAAMGAPAFWSRGIAGAGEAVAVLDSGMRTSHPAFAGLNVASRVFGRYAGQGRCFDDDAQSAEDLQGHGTHVAGIVASQGSAGAEGYLGVARGIGTLYNLKIGFRQKNIEGQCAGKVSSNTGDALEALEWAVFHTPARVFNYSYGGKAQSDDAPGARIFDYLADVYDLTLVVAAGNDGPAPSTLHSPGIGYNLITVANYDDRGTAARADDGAAASSSRGPAAGGRFKPDLAAPGSRIVSAGHASDAWVSLTGTSMAAPHIAGAAALLRQVGLDSALALKAVLLNTADGRGWNAAGGWGYANLGTAAERPYHVRGQAAKPEFYRGRMPENFKATLVWNRHVSDPGSYSRSAFSRMGLYLYSGGNGTLLDASSSPLNNVQQVWSAAAGDAVLKVRAEELGPGVEAEAYAVGISEAGFEKVEPPSLEIRCTAPPSVAAPSAFPLTCEAVNPGQLDALAASAEISLPPGFGEQDTVSFGTIPAGGSAVRVFHLKAGGAGEYNAPVTLISRAWGETFTARTTAGINVTRAEIGGAPSLVVDAGSLSFSHRPRQPAPPARTIDVSSTGGSATFRASTTAAWLRVAPASGSTPAALSVAVEPAGLAAGAYTGMVTVDAPGLANSPQVVTVTLTVTGSLPASLTVRERIMARSAPEGGGCAPPAAADSFAPTDSRAYVWSRRFPGTRRMARSTTAGNGMPWRPTAPGASGARSISPAGRRLPNPARGRSQSPGTACRCSRWRSPSPPRQSWKPA